MIEPYSETIPKLSRPADDLSKPRTREEKLFCWFYWLDVIQNPETTRFVLDSLNYIPSFNAPWGQDRRKRRFSGRKKQHNSSKNIQFV